MNAPVSRHRRPLWRIWRGMGSVALTLLALAIGQAIIAATPDVDRSERPFLKSGPMGAEVDARSFTASVVGVRSSRIIKERGVEHDTQGVWVVVKVKITAGTEPVLINYAALHDGRGRTFLATDRLRQPIADAARTFQPGIAVEGEIAFEVPADTTGLSLRLAESSGARLMDATTDVALPPGPLWLDPQPVTLDPPVVSS